MLDITLMNGPTTMYFRPTFDFRRKYISEKLFYPWPFTAKILHVCNFQKLRINYSKCVCSKWPEIQNLSSLYILKAIHEKKLEAKPLFCTGICTFAIFSVVKFRVQLLKMRMFQMTWNSKLKLPRYIKGHPWKKIGGQTPFLHTNLHICNFQCCQIRSSITQNLYVSNDLKFKT